MPKLNLTAESKRDNIKRLCKDAVSMGLWKSPRRLEVYLQFLFGDICLRNRRFLDIGGGLGLFCAAARALGAREATCVEPGGPGANDSIKAVSSKGGAGFSNGFEVVYVSTTLDSFAQSYQVDSEAFDVILMHNVINHLDEGSCSKLHFDRQARAKYHSKINLLNRLADQNTTLIVCDCMRNNFFPDIGLANPFMRTIEWKKHQNPGVWRDLLEIGGWQARSLQWTTPNVLGKVGRIFGFRAASYFGLGHFRLELRRSID
jgi:hypothetical protein